METMNRREVFTGLAALGTGLLMPLEAEAGDRVTALDLMEEDLEDPTADLQGFRARFGDQIRAVSKPLHNRMTGETVTFLYEEAGGVKWLYSAQPGAFVPFAHRHEQAEIYDVVKGKISVCIEGEWRDVGAGEQVVIPPMAMHEAVNPFEEEVEILVDFDPSTEEVYKMGKVYWLACELGWVKPDGKPRLMKLLPALRQTDSKSYPEGMPRWLVDLAV